MTGPAAAWLPDGRRLHFQHGPIDLVIEAWGPEAERAAAYRRAWGAFRPVLDDLVAVLPLLRTPVTQLVGQGPTLHPAPRRVGPWPTLVRNPPDRLADIANGSARAPARAAPDRPHGAPALRSHPANMPLPSAPMRGRVPKLPGSALPPGIAEGSVAGRMLRATAPHAPVFITPMAAVAGAVADHVLAAMVDGGRLERAYVNNGGDAALWLTPGTEITAAGGPGLADRIRIPAESPVRGVATSGWRGRSHSLGIADAVTVLARTGAEADAAATLVANAVDLPGHPAIRRRPARELAPDSDLGERPVTVAVGPLTGEETARALASGRAAAEAMLARGLIAGAALWLGGRCETAGAATPGAAKI